MLQFFLILLIFVLPPIFAGTPPAEAVNLGRPSFFVLINFLAALFLCLQRNFKEKAEGLQEGGGHKLVKAAFYSSAFLISFGSLLLLGVFSKLLADATGAGVQTAFVAPSGFLERALCVFSFFAGAFYEETLYRRYLPDALGAIGAMASQKAKEAAASGENVASPRSAAKTESFASPRRARLVFWGTEAACVVLFALAHRWQGWPAVLDALLGGTVLRLCAVKCKSLKPGIAAHFLYNLCALFLLP